LGQFELWQPTPAPHMLAGMESSAPTRPYWTPMFCAAWLETRQSFGWTKKTAATVLIALGTIAAVWLRKGWAEMTATAAGYWWLAFGPIVAGFCLFIWNFLEVQATAYRKLEKKIDRLLIEHTVPNYETWKHIPIVTLEQASYLYCDLEPLSGVTKDTESWFRALEAAIQTGELNFIPEEPQYRSQVESEKTFPRRRTKIQKTELRKFADKHGHTPKFLQDEWIKPAAV
jgi:hypothetical protein